jgi:hypothetical protein
VPPTTENAFRLEGAGAPWVRISAFALTLFTFSIVGIDYFWRSLGHGPHVRDSPTLWAFHRCRADWGGNKSIALIGASRMQADVSVGTLQQLCPNHTVVQLAAYGQGSPIAVLDDLASDPGFNGLVLFDMVAPFISFSRLSDQSHFVHYRFSPIQATSLIASLLQCHLVSLKPNLSLRSLVAWVSKNERLPEPEPASVTFDRGLSLDFTRFASIERHRRAAYFSDIDLYQREYTPAVKATFLPAIDHINSSISRIRARGGNVIFVRLPVSGETAELEEIHHPRQLYWSRFASRVNAPCIDCATLPGCYVCPDGSHLDAHAAPSFTSALVATLRKQGLFP